MKKKFLCFTQGILLTGILFSVNVYAIDVVVGTGYNIKNIRIYDNERQTDEIAILDSGAGLTPVLGIRSTSLYFSSDSNWAYDYEIGASLFSINQQEIAGIEDNVDVGTKVTGFSVYVMPLLYYHFNRKEKSTWHYKAGLGMGIGYLSANGNFKITDSTHPDYNQFGSINVNGLDLSVGVYFEAANGNHIVTLRNYIATGKDENNTYSQHNVLMSYQYLFELFFD